MFNHSDFVATTSRKALENSIFWQNWVLKQSTDPKQKQRCIAAIEKLQAQIRALDQQTA